MRRIWPEAWHETQRQNRLRDEENERRAALAKELRRIRAIAGMVERVNGWERFEEMVDAMLPKCA